MKEYRVTASLKFPSANGGNTAEFEIFAKNKKEAIAEARKRVSRAGDFDRHDGPLIYKAEEI